MVRQEFYPSYSFLGTLDMDRLPSRAAYLFAVATILDRSVNNPMNVR
jgi:hypothetical protein